MRPLYLLLWVTLPYILGVFYRRRKVINTQPDFYAQTLFVCNHPSAFIDPLIIANYHKPIIHFMTRSDVFKPWLKPVTWACHMVPIYRTAEDGNDSAEKNIGTFKEAIKILQWKKSLILFGEGYTDDIFIRSLKPIKKGPARMAFSTMVATNWQEDIKVQTVGVNYSHPRYFNCDLIVSAGKIIHLKDYKAAYEENPSRATTQLMREIEKDLQDQITYVKDKSLAPFLEQVQIIQRNGMNHWHRDNRIPLLERYRNSQQMAKHLNENYSSESVEWTSLKSDLEQYFNDETRAKINDNWVNDFARGKGKKMGLRWLALLLLFPIFLVGFVHMFIPYILVKTLVEKMFRREVFWSGVKLLLGALFATLYNLPAIWLFHDYIFQSYWLGFLYFMTVPAISGVIAYNYGLRFADTMRVMSAPKAVLAKFAERRNVLAAKIKQIGF